MKKKKTKRQCLFLVSIHGQRDPSGLPLVSRALSQSGSLQCLWEPMVVVP